MTAQEHPLVEPMVVRSGFGLRWYVAALLPMLVAVLIGSLVGLQAVGLWIGLIYLGGAGIFEWADAIRRWRLGTPSRRELEEWAATVNHHILLRLMREGLRQTDLPGWSLDGQWRQQRLEDDHEDRRRLLYLLYLTAPPWSREQRALNTDELESRRLDLLRSRLKQNDDPWDANGESNRILRHVKDQGLEIWPLTVG